ncbi:MAG: ABC transporter ATP-binding protein [Planctomycetes bacterium]|nr:ABC transporter ATP-binding protein [Planctomycetota bacterium]
MTAPIIRVEHLKKRYRIGALAERRTTLREALANALRQPWQRLRSARSEPTGAEQFWALDDVSFEVNAGDAIGIIGRNGAGKSTLLKVLSQITEPTAGRIELRGRVASLLEVGTGFHSELTGRENIYLNGAILGMTRAEIKRKFDEIVAFAEVERFLDTQVKYYSSGMYMRLAFAVAAHLEPEILIVDEVLAVGDLAFQKKCLGKMEEVTHHKGRTVLFVSHSMQAITTLCSQAVLLDRGRVLKVGAVQDVASAYLQQLSTVNETTVWQGDAGNDLLRLKCARVIGGAGGVFGTDDELRIQMIAEVRQPITGLVYAIEIYSIGRQLLAYTAHDDAHEPPAPRIPPGPFAWELIIPGNSFASGTYEFRLDVGIHNGKRLVNERIAFSITFENLRGIGRRFESSWTQCFRPNWQWRRISATEHDLPLTTIAGSTDVPASVADAERQS